MQYEDYTKLNAKDLDNLSSMPDHYQTDLDYL